MEELVQFYTEEKDTLASELKEVKSKLANLSLLRLGVFLLTSAGIYFLLVTLSM